MRGALVSWPIVMGFELLVLIQVHATKKKWEGVTIDLVLYGTMCEGDDLVNYPCYHFNEFYEEYGLNFSIHKFDTVDVLVEESVIDAKGPKIYEMLFVNQAVLAEISPIARDLSEDVSDAWDEVQWSDVFRDVRTRSRCAHLHVIPCTSAPIPTQP